MFHNPSSKQTIKRKVKEAGVWKIKPIPVPDSILDYNKYMGGVDLSDALVGNYSVRQKILRWYKTFFFHFLDIALVNSYILHKLVFKCRRDPTQEKPLSHKPFREHLIQETLEFDRFDESTADPPPCPAATCMPVYYESNSTQKRRYCKRCHDAGQAKVTTAVYCRKCEVPLCFNSKKNCYQLWHDGLSSYCKVVVLILCSFL